jgi:site-specific DNA recombinase
LFLKAANELFSGKAEIITNTKEMMELVCNTDALDKEVADCIVELNIISEQMQSAILENSRVALNQEEYEKRYAALTERYNVTKEKYDKATEQIEAKKAQRELIKGFIRTLENTGNVAEEFDAGMWCGLVDHVTVTDKDNIVFTFKNGLEIKVS